MIRKILIGLALAIVVMVVLELVLPMGMKDTKPWWHHTTGYFAIYGVVACAALVYVAKALGKLGLQQPEPSDEDEARAPLDAADAPRPDAAAPTTRAREEGPT